MLEALHCRASFYIYLDNIHAKKSYAIILATCRIQEQNYRKMQRRDSGKANLLASIAGY